MASEWNDEQVILLIEAFKNYRCLWDPKDTDRKSKNKKYDAYRKLSIQFKKPKEEIKKKIINLIQSYRSYRRKMKKTKVAGRKYVFKPTWFAFDAINTFMEDVYTPHKTIDTTVDSYKSNDEHDADDGRNTESYIDIIECNGNITEDDNEGKKNPDCLNDTNIKKITFSAPMPPPKKMKIEKDENEIRVSQTYEYLMEKQRESKKKPEKDEFDIYGALVAIKLRKMDEITRQCVMNEMDNLIFKAMIQSTSHGNHNTNLIPHPSQYTTFNYEQQPSPSSSQFSTFSLTSQSSPSHFSTLNQST